MSTNIKVAVRVRNLPTWHGRSDGGKENIKESEAYNKSCVVVDRPDPKTHINTHLVIGGAATDTEEKDFSYDFVFPPTDGQEFLYDNLISPLIEKCEQGFNGCVFVYGQTASGKTYTMGGPAVSKESDKGIIIRVAKQLCQYIEKSRRKDLGKAGYDYQVTGSYLEIYNEQLKDLLGDGKEDLKIRMDPNSVTGRGVYVSGLTQVPLSSEKDYVNAIETGVSKRRVAETNMNAVSSRSHAILTLTLTQREFLEGGKEGVKKSSKIHLIDLAGSERAESTGATGAVLKEGAAINQSLSCLGNVINALSTGSTHVPYRDSKLTHLLSDSLGGNSLTILVACLTPIAGAYDETLSTLRFAQRVKLVKNKAVLNVDANTLRIMALEAENADLKAQLAKCTCGASTIAAGATGASSAAAAAEPQGGRKLNRDISNKWKNMLVGATKIQKENATKLQSIKVVPEEALEDGNANLPKSPAAANTASPSSTSKDQTKKVLQDDEDDQMNQIMLHALSQPSTTAQVMAMDEMKDVKFDQYVHYNNPYAYNLGDEELEETRRSRACWKFLAVLLLALGILVGVLSGRYINGPGTSSNTGSAQIVKAGPAPDPTPVDYGAEEDETKANCINATLTETQTIYSYYPQYTTTFCANVTSSSFAQTATVTSYTATYT